VTLLGARAALIGTEQGARRHPPPVDVDRATHRIGRCRQPVFFVPVQAATASAQQPIEEACADRTIRPGSSFPLTLRDYTINRTSLSPHRTDPGRQTTDFFPVLG